MAMDWNKHLGNGRTAAVAAPPDRPGSGGLQLVTPPAVVKEPYRAFDAPEVKYPRFAIYRIYACPIMPRYTALEHVYWNPDGSEVTLIMRESHIVEIEGRNLMELVDALQTESVEWLMAFDEKRHEPPRDEAAPFISFIKLTINGQEMELAKNA